MTLKELRDKLVEQRTLYQKSVEASDNACQKIKECLAKFDHDTLEVLRGNGFDLSNIINVDLNLLRESPEALDAYSQQLDDVVRRLHLFLEKELNG